MKACVAITSYFGRNVKIYFWKKRLLCYGLQMEQETLRVVTIAMICAPLA